MTSKLEAEADRLGGMAGETVRTIQRVADSKTARKAEKAADKAGKKAMKQAKKDAKKAKKQGLSSGEDGSVSAASGSGAKEARFTPQKARNAVGVAKVLAPVVVPVVAPYVVRAAGFVREAYDRRQARKLGVGVDQLAEYTGRGGGLLARIGGVSMGLTDLRNSALATAQDEEFAKHSQDVLEQLSATVRASERMPSARRKAAHRGVCLELNRLEGELLRRLDASARPDTAQHDGHNGHNGR